MADDDIDIYGDDEGYTQVPSNIEVGWMVSAQWLFNILIRLLYLSLPAFPVLR